MTVMQFPIWKFLSDLHSGKDRENFHNLLEVLLEIWKLSTWNQLEYIFQISNLFTFIIKKQ